MALAQEHAAWFAENRGIRRDTLEHFGCWSRNGRLVFPYGDRAWKERPMPRPADGERRFYFHPMGSKPPLFNLGEATKKDVFLVEGESDCMRLWQEFHDAGADVGVVAISGLDNWSDSFSVLLRQAERIFVVLDNDEDYLVQAKVEARWIAIHRALAGKARRVRLPAGVKDLCEFFTEYSLDGFRTVVESAGTESHYYTPLDLTGDPPPPDWLVEGLICRGDLAMLIAEPGAGKSWLGFDLAVAVAEGRSSWMGFPVPLDGPGRVLYVDEENPIDVPLNRLKQLGLTDAGAARIRFFLRQGVRLDRHPGHLLDEALTWQPDLIVLDSLTRLHTRNENSAGEMAVLFNDGIVPLARDTGAATLLLHHVNKTDGTSSFGRVRGSSDLPGVIDVGLDVRPLGDDRFSMATFKVRRGREPRPVEAKRQDTADGRVLLIPNPEAPI